MTMKYADEELEVIRGVIEHGGIYTIEIDASEIPMTEVEEAWDGIAPVLTSGFEMPPSTVIQDPVAANEILTKVDTWGQIVVLVYRSGGRIIYRKLHSGRYEASVSREES
jgi:hypothetical protein